MSSIKIAFLLDSIALLNVKKDTSIAMMLAAQQKNWKLYYFQQEDFFLNNGELWVNVAPVHIFEDAIASLQEPWYELETSQAILAKDLSVIMMRKDPPFDMAFVYSTYFLEMAERAGVLVVNRPKSLRDCNEKLFATYFPECCPPVLVSYQAKEIRDFHRQHGDIILKPLDGMGGASIFRVKEDDPNVSVIIETLTEFSKTPIMAQKYLSDIKQGDKRILMVDGEPASHCLARIPSKGETRGNLAAGGTGEVRELSARDRWIAEKIGPELKQRGILFAGLDIIGDYLTEINVTSPTCVREIDREAGTHIAEDLMNVIAERLN